MHDQSGAGNKGRASAPRFSFDRFLEAWGRIFDGSGKIVDNFKEVVGPITASVLVVGSIAKAATEIGFKSPLTIAMTAVASALLLIVVLQFVAYRRQKAKLRGETSDRAADLPAPESQQQGAATPNLNLSIRRPWEQKFVEVSSSIARRDAALIEAIEAQSTFIDQIQQSAKSNRKSGEPTRAATKFIGAARRYHARLANALLSSAKDNAQALANCAAHIFREQLGHKCTVTVLVLESQGRVDIYIGDDGAVSRPAGPRYTISANAATAHVSKYLTPYICNDCKDSNSGFRYSSPNWQSRFNALLVVGIPEKDPRKKGKYSGFLCIDSDHAVFDRASCINWATQFANYLSTSIYATKVCERIREWG